MGRSNGYIVGFAVAVCLVCSVVVSSSSVALKPRQETNKILDRQLKVLSLVGLIEEGAKLSPADAQQLFDDNIRARVINLGDGTEAKDVDAATFDQKKVAADPATSAVAKPNGAKVARVPNQALIYELKAGDDFDMLVIPVEGKGLWSTLYGFVAVGKDLNTVKGITFYQHAETPGLGGEVDNPRWKGLWPGRQIFNEKGAIAIEVIKGQAGPVANDPYRVDGLSGATLTSRGVTELVRFWFGDQGFGHYLARLKKGGGKA